MTVRDELALRARERQAAVAQAVLNRALRHDKGRLDVVATRIVMSQMPEVPDDQVGGGAAQRGRLDAPPKRRE